MQDSSVELWDSEFGLRDSNYGFRVSGFGFQVSGFGIWNSSSWAPVSRFELRISGAQVVMLDWMSSFEFRVSGFVIEISCFGILGRASGFGIRVSGLDPRVVGSVAEALVGHGQEAARERHPHPHLLH